MFVDISGFTRLCTQLSAEAIKSYINESVPITLTLTPNPNP